MSQNEDPITDLVVNAEGVAEQVAQAFSWDEPTGVAYDPETSYITHQNGDELSPAVDYVKFLARCDREGMSQIGVESLLQYLETMGLPILNRPK